MNYLKIRKNGLVFVNMIVIISSILNIISKFIKTYITIMISRFLAGIYCGLYTGILPLYLSECSSRNLRGLSGTFSQLGITFGNVVQNVMGLSVLLGTHDLWPVLMGTTLIPVLAHVWLYFLSESPKFIMINKNDKDKARSSKII